MPCPDCSFSYNSRRSIQLCLIPDPGDYDRWAQVRMPMVAFTRFGGHCYACAATASSAFSGVTYPIAECKRLRLYQPSTYWNTSARAS